MSKAKTAKLFKNGASQAVRLPMEYRFDCEEVYISRDERTGDVVLSSRPGSRAWEDFFELARSVEIPKEFMKTRPLNTLPKDRDLFGEER